LCSGRRVACIPSKAAETAASTGIGDIRAIRSQNNSFAGIFFATRPKFFGRNIAERLEVTPGKLLGVKEGQKKIHLQLRLRT
jgi:hypothetical protein